MLETTIKKIINSRENRSILLNADLGSLSKISIDAAYDVQKKVINGLRSEVSGWKLGGTNVKTRNTFNVSGLYWGAVLKGGVVKNSTEINLQKGEVEIAFKFNEKIESLNKVINEIELGGYIDSVALAIEYPWSVFEGFGKAGVLALISDCCASGMCLLGEDIPFNEFSGKVSVKVNIDGVEVESGSSEKLVDGVYKTLTDFINDSLAHGFELKADQWVFTGGITSCRVYEQGSFVQLICEGLPGLSFKAP